MNKEKCKKLLESGFLKDWSDGKQCQYSMHDTKWTDIDKDEDLDFSADCYRVKPQPKYIPFTAETAFAAGLHRRKVLYSEGVGPYKVYIGENAVTIFGSEYSFFSMLNSFKFVDTKTPCGVQVGNCS